MDAEPRADALAFTPHFDVIDAECDTNESVYGPVCLASWTFDGCADVLRVDTQSGITVGAVSVGAIRGAFDDGGGWFIVRGVERVQA